jgi:ribosomal protein S6
MRSYELALVVRPSLTDTQRKKIVESVKAWLKDLKFIKEDEWGQRVLSYPIKHETAGFYLVYQLEGETFPKDFDKRVTNTDGILRHLLVRKK